MKKIIFSKYGEAQEVAELIEVENLQLSGSDDVLISLVASPINPSDFLTSTGDYGLSPVKLPSGLGKEVMGRVEQTGKNVKDISIGDLVYFSSKDNAWTEEFIRPRKSLTLLPNNTGIDPLQQCLGIASPLTAYLMLERYVNLSSGEWIIQNSANSSVGTNVIKIAKMKGIRTVNIVRNEGSVQQLLDIGSDIVLVQNDYLSEQVEEALEGADIKLALDAIGGVATNDISRCLTYGGLVLNYGLLSGKNCQLSPKLTIFNEITLKGFCLTSWYRAEMLEYVREVMDMLIRQVSNGELSVPLEANYSLDQYKEALSHASKSGRHGKILFTGPGYSRLELGDI